MSEQTTGPAEVLTLAEYWGRVCKGQRVDQASLILLPVAAFQVFLQHLHVTEAIFARHDASVERRRELVAQLSAMLDEQSNHPKKGPR